LKHIQDNNCELYNDKGGKVHAKNLGDGSKTIIHNGHKDVSNFTAKAICKQLGVPFPKSFQ